MSSVLTGRKYVTPQTRQRIETAIEELGYTVNYGARALATSRTMVIGLVVNLHGLEYAPALASFVFAVSDAAQAAGYDILMLTETDATGAIGRVARTRRVDGLVLLNILDDDPRLTVLQDHAVKAVLLGAPHDSRGIDTVDLDFAAAARELLDLLYAKGHRDVLFARRSPTVFAQGHAFVRRFNESAFAHAHDLGIRLRPFDCPEDPQQLTAVLADSLRRRGAATALMLHDDAATVLLPTALHELNLNVPHDLSVVSLHSTELGQALALPYTSVESDAQRIADACVAQLLRRMTDEGSDAAPVRELLPPRVTIRDSVREIRTP